MMMMPAVTKTAGQPRHQFSQVHKAERRRGCMSSPCLQADGSGMYAPQVSVED
jgi:hypothetical protein